MKIISKDKGKEEKELKEGIKGGSKRNENQFLKKGNEVREKGKSK